MYYKRTLTPYIANASDTFPVVLVTGPRQVGKTTIFEKCAEPGRTYISLDDPILLESAKSDPALFFKTYTPPLLIDEIQNAPELFPYIKMIVDREKKNGLFWLTGSQVFNLMKNVSESLAGRVAVLDLQGLSQSEKEKRPETSPFIPSLKLRRDVRPMDLPAIYSVIFRGSFPRLVSEDKINWKLFYGSYVRTYIERDVRQILNLTQEIAFMKFVKVLAARTGQLLNYSELARDVDVSVNTAKNWLSVLEASGLVFLVRPYSNNLTSKAVKTPKVYFYDTGLVAYLTGYESPEALSSGIINGAILETYVVSEIVKSYIHNGEPASVYFYRDTNNRELDLIVEKGNILYPIEIKRTASPSKNDARHFGVLEKTRMDVGLGAVVCLVDSPVSLGPDIVAMPVAYL